MLFALLFVCFVFVLFETLYAKGCVFCVCFVVVVVMRCVRFVLCCIAGVLGVVFLCFFGGGAGHPNNKSTSNVWH